MSSQKKISRVLFLPFNDNHVLIFDAIIKLLNGDYKILCHDKIAEAPQYHTEALVKQKKLSYMHFPEEMRRSPNDNFFKRFLNILKIRKQIRNILRAVAPDVVVFAIDNDPISQVTIREARSQGIRTLLVPEGLIQPYDLLMRKIYFSGYFYRMLRFLGICLNYIKYGTGGCDNILVSGKRALETLRKIGVPENKMTVVGQQKYDLFIKKAREAQPHTNERKTYLFAASKRIMRDEAEIRLLQEVIETASGLDMCLIIKLHPRTSESPDDLYRIISCKNSSSIKVIKEGYDTFEVLSKVDAVITIPSAIILEVLMLNKECLIATYLEGESFDDYIRYDAIHFINSEKEASDVIRKSAVVRKSYDNKMRLLEDELYKLDGCSGARAAEFIKGLIK